MSFLQRLLNISSLSELNKKDYEYVLSDEFFNILLESQDYRSPNILRELLKLNGTYVTVHYIDPLGFLISAMEKILLSEKQQLTFIEEEDKLSKPKSHYNFLEYLDILFEFGLYLEKDFTIDDENRYIGQLFNIIMKCNDSYKRKILLKFTEKLISKGFDINNDVIFLSTALLIKSKPTNNNFETIIDIFNFLLENNYDINYGFIKPITCENIRYENCTLYNLAVIYNRYNLVHWLLNFKGPIPIHQTEQELYVRDLDIYSMVLVVDEEIEEDKDDYTEIKVLLNVEKNEEVETEENVKTVLELAMTHNCDETLTLLNDYIYLLNNRKLNINPCIHDVSKIVYDLN